jgi:hypothetical protein
VLHSGNKEILNFDVHIKRDESYVCQVDLRTDGKMDEREMYLQTNRKMKRWIDRLTDREKEEKKHTQYDGQTDKL